MKATLTIEIEFDPDITNAQSISDTIDYLIETGMSTPGIMEDHSNPYVGPSYVMTPIQEQAMRWAREAREVLEVNE